MSEKSWVRVCGAAEAPTEGQLLRVEAIGREVCLARVNGALHAVDNNCPHRMGPMHEGWVENGELVCPWHGWTFSPETGRCSNASGALRVYPVRVEGDAVEIEPV